MFFRCLAPIFCLQCKHSSAGLPIHTPQLSQSLQKCRRVHCRECHQLFSVSAVSSSCGQLQDLSLNCKSSLRSNVRWNKAFTGFPCVLDQWIMWKSNSSIRNRILQGFRSHLHNSRSITAHYGQRLFVVLHLPGTRWVSRRQKRDIGTCCAFCPKLHRFHKRRPPISQIISLFILLVLHYKSRYMMFTYVRIEHYSRTSSLQR